MISKSKTAIKPDTKDTIYYIYYIYTVYINQLFCEAVGLESLS